MITPRQKKNAEKRMLREWATLSDWVREIRTNCNDIEEYFLIAKLRGWACIDGVQRDRRIRPPRAVATGNRWLISENQLHRFCWKRRVTVEWVIAKAIARGWQIARTPAGYVVTWSEEPEDTRASTTSTGELNLVGYKAA